MKCILNLYSFSETVVAVIIFNQFVGLATKYHLEFVNNIQVTFTNIYFFNTALKRHLHFSPRDGEKYAVVFDVIRKKKWL